MKYQRFIFFLLFCWMSGSHVVAAQQNRSAGDSTVNIFGSCWDISTGVDLKVKASALVNGMKVYIGESNDEGKFNLQIPGTTTELTFESRGYQTVTTPVSIQGKTKKTDKFRVAFRMIAIDSQQVVKKYQPKLSANNGVSASQQETVPTHFEVRDVYLHKLLTSKICLKFSSGHTFCLDTDSLKAPIASFIGELENINVTVTSEGYHTYTGSLKAKNISGEALYQIQLLRALNPVSLSLETPENLDAELLFSKNDQFHTSFEIKKGKERRDVLFDAYQLANIPGPVRINALKSHRKLTEAWDGNNLPEYLASRKKMGDDILLEDSYTIYPGLTLKSIHIEKPKEEIADSPVKDTVRTKTFSPENVTLYFDQSSYLLRTQTKITLDSISEFLLKNPNLIARLTGHTDNVGKRDLNIRLSEYRGRVVANYLQKKGVPQPQIVFRWQGPDAPVTPNDSEENKVKNRRVEMVIVNK